ncbi:lytic transglycosylase domain-containing protein [Roseospirillum parvum]|uniref:Soluble lytic murein transglycosylase n=1 Tax=Roseospirillum parvum TaxID=83401 RepID=A0A1G7W410_9PROT|nr:lytic transglycosylase domain-containing protein [Roseospirillum parvum]SDG66744.1 Soluble lytic murein transglycosylase [Roseospirillum parvum]
MTRIASPAFPRRSLAVLRRLSLLVLLAALLLAGADAVRAAPLPEPLAADQADLYRRIFERQERGDMATAERLMARLDDRLLLGHLLAQRYLHPSAYRSRFVELKAWLGAYADLPQARRIHHLAERKGGRDLARTLPRPAGGMLTGSGEHGGGVRLRQSSYRHLAATEKARAERLWRRFRHRLRNGWTLSVKRLITEDDDFALLTPADRHRMKGALAHAYFVDGHDDWVLKWAGEALAGPHADHLAHWPAGLAHWRLGHIAEARRHFEALAASDPDRVSGWLVSAAAYWAARANLKDHRPHTVSRWLAVAAEYPRTFYGVLARRALGLPLRPRWDDSRPDAADLQRIAATPAGRRALALFQVGRPALAEGELRKLASSALANDDDPLARAILGLADAAGRPALAMRLGAELGDPVGPIRVAGRFPEAPWTPSGGWRVDRALVLAFIRQESGFDPQARSPAGARGLMQLMPATARWMAERLGRPELARRLAEPAVNLYLGQAYLEHLMELPQVGPDLFRLTAAYNAGPGRLAGWLDPDRHHDDPLLFIESLSSHETRVFIERVVSNFWIYRDRLGQPTPSLDAVVEGDWPTYQPQDVPPAPQVARKFAGKLAGKFARQVARVPREAAR